MNFIADKCSIIFNSRRKTTIITSDDTKITSTKNVDVIACYNGGFIGKSAIFKSDICIINICDISCSNIGFSVPSVNAADNKQRDKNMTTIKITVDP